MSDHDELCPRSKSPMHWSESNLCECILITKAGRRERERIAMAIAVKREQRASLADSPEYANWIVGYREASVDAEKIAWNGGSDG